MYTLPPPFTPLLTALIGNNHLSAALFRSYARLYAAAWPYAYQCTAALDFESQVVVLLGVSRSQARQHLRLLRQSGLINWSSDGSHRYIFRFAAPQLSIYPGPDNQPIQAHLPSGGSDQSSSRAAGQSRAQNPGQAGAHGKADPSAEKLSPDPKRQPGESGKPDYGVVGVNLCNHSLNQDRFTHQHTDSGKTYGALDAAQSAPPDPQFAQVFQFLRRAGVWSKSAERLAQQIAANEQRADPELPGVGDVLGWIAYCYADREQNQISNPAAVLAANLTNNRPCPQIYRPPRICTYCHRSQEHCKCKPGKAEYTYPSEFLMLAMKGANKYSTYADRWGVCMYCHATPCQCE